MESKNSRRRRRGTTEILNDEGEQWSLPDRANFEEHQVKFFKNIFGVKNFEQNIHLWYFSNPPPQTPGNLVAGVTPTTTPTLLFCSPSGATLPRLQKIRYLATALSCNLVMFEYRPNGMSSGIISPSLATLTEDVHYVINWLIQEKGTNVNDIILMGYSLGGLPAISVAVKVPEIKRLVLVNSFSSFACVTAERFSPLLNGLMFFKDFFPDLTEEVKRLTQSIAVVYTENDEVIPRTCTEQTINHVSSSRIEISMSGDHSVFKIDKDKLMILRGFLGIPDNHHDNDKKIQEAIDAFNSTYNVEANATYNVADNSTYNVEATNSTNDAPTDSTEINDINPQRSRELIS